MENLNLLQGIEVTDELLSSYFEVNKWGFCTESGNRYVQIEKDHNMTIYSCWIEVLSNYRLENLMELVCLLKAFGFHELAEKLADNGR